MNRAPQAKAVDAFAAGADPRGLFSARTRVWLKANAVGSYLDVSGDWVARRRLAWRDEPLRGRIRHKFLQFSAQRRERRYYWPDVLRLLEPAVDPAALPARWLAIESAARFLGVSRDAVEDRMVRWSPVPVAGKIRSVRLLGGNRRCYPPDLDALLTVSPGWSEGTCVITP